MSGMTGVLPDKLRLHWRLPPLCNTYSFHGESPSAAMQKVCRAGIKRDSSRKKRRPQSPTVLILCVTLRVPFLHIALFLHASFYSSTITGTWPV